MACYVCVYVGNRGVEDERAGARKEERGVEKANAGRA